MLKLVLTPIILFMVFNSHAAFPVANASKEVINKESKRIDKAAQEIILNISVEDYERYTGKKLGFIGRLLFKTEKRHLVNQLSKPEGADNLNVGGFVLGLLYGPIGLLAAYIFSKNDNFRRSAFIGFKAWLLILLVLMLILLAAAGGKFR
jgi:hypothetical protein